MSDEKGSEDGPNRILVFLRIRPKNSRDGYDDGATDLMDLQPDNQTLYIDGGKPYTFDWIWNGTNVSQEDVFQRVAQPVIANVFKGFWGTNLVYGQTGTGKSFSMCNFDPKAEGIIPRTMRYVFERIDSEPDRKYTICFSFIQIYLDKLGDLFNPEAPELKLARDKDGVCFPGVVEHTITDAADFREKYEDGNQYRVITATKMNPESSRGHAALFIQVKSVPTDDPGGEVRNGKLFLVDLAGYERFSKTGVQEGVMKEEAKTINASLLSLGNCVSALSDKSEHIPWRNAKLTRMLEDAIGGKAKCSIILTAGPSSEHHHETLGTLYFGSRAMAVKTNAKLAVKVDYQVLAKKLQEMLNEAHGKISGLELEATKRQLEREQAEGRMQQEWGTIKQHQEDQLQQLLSDGASPEKVKALIEANKAENELLEEQHYQERSSMEERHEEDLKLAMVAEQEKNEGDLEVKTQGMSSDTNRLQRDLATAKDDVNRYKKIAKDAEDAARKLNNELNDVRLNNEMDLDLPSSGGGGVGVASADMKKDMQRRVEAVKTMLEESYELKLADVEEPLREEIEKYQRLYEDLKATADDNLTMTKDALCGSYEEEIATIKKNSHDVQEKLKKNHMTIKKSYQAQKDKLETENSELLDQIAQLTGLVARGGAPMDENVPRTGALSLAETVIMKKQAEKKVDELDAKVKDMITEREYLETEKEALQQQLKEYEPKAGEERIKPAMARRLKEELDKLRTNHTNLEKEMFKLKAAQALSGPQETSRQSAEEEEEEDQNKEDIHGDYEGLKTFVDKMLRFPYFHGADAIQNEHQKILDTLTTDLDDYRRMMKFRFLFMGPSSSGKSSVIKCLTAQTPPVLKKVPEVSTPTIHPGILTGTVEDQFVGKQDWHKLYVKFEDVEATPKTGGLFGGGGGGKGVADPAKLHVDIIDTPGAPEFWRGYPSFLLPGKNVVYCITYDLSHPVDIVKAAIATQLNTLQASAVRNYPKSVGGDAPRIGVCLIGTHRDGMRERSDAATIAHLAKVTMALGDIFYRLRGEDTYGLVCVGNFATSCKDWTVLSIKEKRGPTTFRELYVFLGAAANQLYNNRPSAFLPSATDSVSHTTYMLGDDLRDNENEKTSKLDEAQKRLRKGIVTLVAGLLREQRVRWILSESELRALVAKHLDLDPRSKLGISATNYIIRELLVRCAVVAIPPAVLEPKYLPKAPEDQDPDAPLVKREGLIALDPLRILTLYSLFAAPATLSAAPKNHPMLQDKNTLLFDHAAYLKAPTAHQRGLLAQELSAVVCARVLPLCANEMKLLYELYCVMGFGIGLRQEVALLSPMHFRPTISPALGEYLPYLLSCHGDGIGRKYKLNAVSQAWFARLQLKLVPFSHAPNREKQYQDTNWNDASYLVLEKSRLKWGILGSRVVKDAVMQAALPVRGLLRQEGEHIYIAITARHTSPQASVKACKDIMNAIHYEITALNSREFRGVRASYQEMTVGGCEGKRPKLAFGIEAILRRFGCDEEAIQQQIQIVGNMTDLKGGEIEAAVQALPANMKEF